LLVETLKLVMPPSPLIAPEAVIVVAVYSTRAVLQGKGHDVWEMVVENIS
jgi:pyruvate dehydrogenase (quinone)